MSVLGIVCFGIGSGFIGAFTAFVLMRRQEEKRKRRQDPDTCKHGDWSLSSHAASDWSGLVAECGYCGVRYRCSKITLERKMEADDA